MFFLKLRILIHVAVVLPFFASAALAEWVIVQAGPTIAGIGLLFRDGQVCRVISPAHVFRDSDQVTVRTPGDPNSYRLRRAVTSPSADIAVANFVGEYSGCRTSWDFTLPNANLDVIVDAMDGNATAALRTIVNRSNERVDAAISRYDQTHIYFTVPAELSERSNIQGLSGSGLFVGTTLIGLVTSFDNFNNQFVAIRSELVPQYLRLRPTNTLRPTNATLGPSQVGESTAVVPAASSMEELWPPFATTCDYLASNPADAERFPSSVHTLLDDIAVNEAIAACRDDVAAAERRSPRLQYQYARALHAQINATIEAGDEVAPGLAAGALAELDTALRMGHEHAIVNIEGLLLDTPEVCSDARRCLTTYRNLLYVLQERSPARHDYRYARLLAYEDVEGVLCPDSAACDQEAGAIFESLIGTELETLASANYGYLLVHGRVSRECPEDENCSLFSRNAFQAAANDGETWSLRELGSLLVERRFDERLCADPQACLEQGIEHLESALANGSSWAANELGDLYASRPDHDSLQCLERRSITCDEQAMQFYQRGIELGNMDLRLDAAWLYLYRPISFGCEEGDTSCAQLAYDLLSSGPNTSDWAHSLRAHGMRSYPQEFAGFCGDVGCEQAALTEALLAADSRGYDAERAAQTLLYGLYATDRLSCGAGQTSDASCFRLGIELVGRSYFEFGRENAGTTWSIGLSNMLSAIIFEEAVSEEIVTPTEAIRPVIIEDFDSYSAARSFAYEEGCHVYSDRCSEIFADWLHMIEQQTENTSLWNDYNTFRVLGAISSNDGFSQSADWQNVQERARALLISQLRIWYEGGERSYSGGVWDSLNENCRSEACRSFINYMLENLPEMGRGHLINQLVFQAISSECGAGSGEPCLPIAEQDLLLLTSHLRFDDYSNVVSRPAYGPLADAYNEQLISEGVFEFAASRAYSRVWSDDGTYLLNDPSWEEVVEVIFPIVNQVEAHPLDWASMRVAPAAATAAFWAWEDEIPSDVSANFLLAVHLMQWNRTPETSLESWMGWLSRPIIEEIQRTIGTEVDGNWGVNSTARLEAYSDACGEDRNCNSARIRAAATEMLEAVTQR